MIARVVTAPRDRSTRTRPSTRCTPTSCGRTTRNDRSSTASSATSTAGASPPAGSSHSRAADPSSTWRRSSSDQRTGSPTRRRCPRFPNPRRCCPSARCPARGRGLRPAGSRTARVRPHAGDRAPARRRGPLDPAADRGDRAAQHDLDQDRRTAAGRSRPAQGLPRLHLRPRTARPEHAAARRRLPHAWHASRQRRSAIWFHDVSRVDEWLLYVMDSPWSGGGRGFNRGQVFRRDGRRLRASPRKA